MFFLLLLILFSRFCFTNVQICEFILDFLKHLQKSRWSKKGFFIDLLILFLSSTQQGGDNMHGKQEVQQLLNTIDDKFSFIIFYLSVKCYVTYFTLSVILFV